MTVQVEPGARIKPADLPAPIDAPRLLFRTKTFPNPNHFNEDFAALSPELVHHCDQHGVRLVGLDTPSVDLCHDRQLLSHTAIAEHDMAILEGVVLDDVNDGFYTLIALPLPIRDCDASPVRAVLVPFEDSAIFHT